MESLKDYKQAGKDLYDKLHLATYPIAIKYIKDVNEIPKRAIRPLAQRRKLSICQAFTLARRMGMSVAITSEDNFCTPATVMHRWVDISQEDFIESQVLQGWHKDVEAERRRAEAMIQEALENKKFEGYCGLVCSPLPKTILIPDSVLVYCNGAQLTQIIHALSYEYKREYIPVTPFEGFGESCAKGGLIPFVTQKPQIVIPGMGDRAFAGISEHEVGIGMPSNLVFYILENLFKTGGILNIGYPVKSLIPLGLSEKITPGFKFLREKINKKLNKK